MDNQVCGISSSVCLWAEVLADRHGLLYHHPVLDDGRSVSKWDGLEVRIEGRLH